jgi:hypothetical protein
MTFVKPSSYARERENLLLLKSFRQEDCGISFHKSLTQIQYTLQFAQPPFVGVLSLLINDVVRSCLQIHSETQKSKQDKSTPPRSNSAKANKQ